MLSEPQSGQRQQNRSTADDSPPHKLPRKRPLKEEIDIDSPEKDKVNLASSSSAWPSNKSPRHARQRSASIASIHSILSAKLEPPAMLGNAALPSSPKTCSYHDGPFAVLGGFEDIPFLITRALLTDYPRGTIVVLHSETRLILQDDTLPLIAGPVCMTKLSKGLCATYCTNEWMSRLEAFLDLPSDLNFSVDLLFCIVLAILRAELGFTPVCFSICEHVLPSIRK